MIGPRTQLGKYVTHGFHVIHIAVNMQSCTRPTVILRGGGVLAWRRKHETCFKWSRVWYFALISLFLCFSFTDMSSRSDRLLRSGEYNISNRQKAAKKSSWVFRKFRLFLYFHRRTVYIPRKSQLCVIRSRQRFFQPAKSSVISHNADSGITSPPNLLL